MNIESPEFPRAFSVQRRRVLAGAGAAGVSALFAPAFALAAPDATTARILPLQALDFLTLGRRSGSVADKLKQVDADLEWKAALPAYAPAVEALRSGAADFTVGGATPFLTATLPEKDLLVFAVERDSLRKEGIVATGKSGARSIPDLVGKRVAVNKGGTGEYLLRLALKRHGISPDKVEPVYLAPPDAAAAFAQNHVDAWATWNIFLATAQTEPGAQVLARGPDIGSVNYPVYVVTRAYAQRHPEVVKAVYDALLHESEVNKKDPEPLVQLHVQAGVPARVVDVIREEAPAPTLTPGDAAFQHDLETLADFFAEQKLSATRIDISNTTYDVTRGA